MSQRDYKPFRQEAVDSQERLSRSFQRFIIVWIASRCIPGLGPRTLSPLRYDRLAPFSSWPHSFLKVITYKTNLNIESTHLLITKASIAWSAHKNSIFCPERYKIYTIKKIVAHHWKMTSGKVAILRNPDGCNTAAEQLIQYVDHCVVPVWTELYNCITVFI